MSHQMKLIFFVAATLFFPCRAAITSLHFDAASDTAENRDPSTNLDTKPLIRRLQIDNPFDASHYGLEYSGRRLIGNPDKHHTTYLIYVKCPEDIELTASLLRKNPNGIITQSHHVLNFPTNADGIKLFFLHDLTRGSQRINAGEGRYVQELSRDYYYASIGNDSCQTKVTEVDAAEENDRFFQQKFTKFSAITDDIMNFKVIKKASHYPLCMALVHQTIWGVLPLMFGHVTDGDTFYEHIGKACQGHFEYPTEEVQFIYVRKQGGNIRVWTTHKHPQRTEGSWLDKQFTIQNKTLQEYFQHVGDDSTAELDSIGIWYSSHGNYDEDIEVKDISLYEEAIELKKDFFQLIHWINRYFTPVGKLSTTPIRVVARKKASVHMLCGVLVYIDTNADLLLAGYVSNGLRFWSSTKNHCIEEYDEAVAEQLTIRMQMLDESVKVGVTKDANPELVIEISTNGVGWYENFEVMGIVHSLDEMTYEITDTEDMTDLKTNKCLLSKIPVDPICDARTSNPCQSTTEGTAVYECRCKKDFVHLNGDLTICHDKCEESKITGNPICDARTSNPCHSTTDGNAGYQCPCKKDFVHINGDLTICHDKCEELKITGNPVCDERTSNPCKSTTKNDDGYECPCKKHFDHLNGILTSCHDKCLESKMNRDPICDERTSNPCESTTEGTAGYQCPCKKDFVHVNGDLTSCHDKCEESKITGDPICDELTSNPCKSTTKNDDGYECPCKTHFDHLNGILTTCHDRVDTGSHGLSGVLKHMWDLLRQLYW